MESDLKQVSIMKEQECNKENKTGSAAQGEVCDDKEKNKGQKENCDKKPGEANKDSQTAEAAKDDKDASCAEKSEAECNKEKGSKENSEAKDKDKECASDASKCTEEKEEKSKE
jgi:hypothetical protein